MKSIHSTILNLNDRIAADVSHSVLKECYDEIKKEVEAVVERVAKKHGGKPTAPFGEIYKSEISYSVGVVWE